MNRLIVAAAVSVALAACGGEGIDRPVLNDPTSGESTPTETDSNTTSNTASQNTQQDPEFTPINSDQQTSQQTSQQISDTSENTTEDSTGNNPGDDDASSTSNGVLSNDDPGDDDASSTSNGVVSNDDPAPTPTPPTVTTPDFTAPSGGSLIRSSSLNISGLETKSSGVSSAGGDQFATMQVGDFQLMQNAWRAWRAADGHDWKQAIFTNTNGAPVSWSYDWGPGVPGVNGRASDDYYVRSYPELIYGVKDEHRTSAPKATIGLPVRVDNLPNYAINYSYNAPEYGPGRTVDASVNSRFPNGTTINGERNVAVESFFYNSVGGVCDDNTPVTRDGGSNHTYEVMVWLDSGAERLPAAPRDYVTDITLRGQPYGVYTKASDPRYIAFVARNPQNTGILYWNDFIEWARVNAHTVQQQFGANANAVKIEDSWCMANIIIGTEIFWGEGNFDLLEWTITQSR